MKKLLAIIIVALIGHWLVDAFGAVNYDRMAPHPRLLLAAGGENGIKRAMAEEPALVKVHDRIMGKCRDVLTVEPVRRIKEGKRLLAVSREALTRIYYLSYAYRMTGDKNYARRAEKEMLAVSGFTDWNPSHFLDVGEMVMAVALGYDWLYDELSSETRACVRQAILDKGFKASENDGHAWFYKSKTNWNSVCNGGLLYGALAIYEDEPEAARVIIEKCLRTNPQAMEGYGPDGGYPEGFMYWGYGTGFQVMLIAALESALGSDFGLASAPGFLESARFMQYMTAPSGQCFNFSDAHSSPEANMMLYWFAKKLNDPSVVYLERKYLDGSDTHFAEPRLLPSMMVFASQIDMMNLKSPENQFWVNRGDTPVFIYRGGWDSPSDTYLGVKGGSASTSHAHMDAGSFVFERDGVRWAMDLGMQSYITLESRGVDLWNQRQDGQRWDVFRLGNLSHNTLTVNGQRHAVNGKAEIIGTFREKGRKGAVVDLTSTLANGLASAVRTVVLDDVDNLEVVDEIMAPADSIAQVMWVMATPAVPHMVDGHTMELSKDGKLMLMSVDAGDLPLEMHVWDNNPPHDYDHPNPESCRVGFTITLPEGKHAAVKVKLSLI